MPSRRPYPTSRRTTAPFFCSTQAWSFFRYGLDRVNSMPCSLQNPINTSLRNSLPLSVSILRNENGSASRSRSTASTTAPASRTSSGTHSVQALAISVSTSVHTKLPAIDDPQCATRSASTKPGAGSCQSPNVRTGTLPRTRSPPERRRRRGPAVTALAGARRRSIVAALTSISCSRTRGSRVRWPCRSSAGTRVGSNAFRRFPHTRSEASHSTTSPRSRPRRTQTGAPAVLPARPSFRSGLGWRACGGTR